MKKIFVITLIIGIAVSVGTLGARAAQVSEGQARNIAAQFMAQKRLGSIDTASPSMLRGAATSQPAIYVFNTAKRGDGWVIVSGDNRALPVLGYSDHGYCNLDSMPENMREWLEMYVAQIESLDDGGSGNTGDALPVLGNVASNDAPMPKGNSVSPLIASKWGQGYPYNSYCPSVDGTHCVTGCVATAMAQIMRYHLWPQSPSQNIPSYYWETGNETLSTLATTTFDWASMTNTYPSSGGNTTANNAVARLMQYCGRAVKMDYGKYSSSGTSSYRNVWVDYFRYSPNARYMFRCDYTYNQWTAFIKNELNNHRPILYRGQKTPGGGHAFVLDGCDESGYFHFNWGWSGNYDGYFSLESLNPAGGGIGSSPGENGYVITQAMLIGIRPNTTAATEWNEVVGCSGVSAAITSYTRSSSTDPFVINVSTYYRSFATLYYTFDLGWGVYDETGHQLLQVYNSLPGQEFGAGESKTFTRTLNFGANLPNGTYYLRPICRQSSSSSLPWRPCHYSGTEYIRATINGNNLTLEAKNKGTKNGMTASINAYGTLKKVNRPLSVLVKVTNTRSISGSINLYLFADNVMEGSQAVTVEMGSSTTTSIKFIPKTSGTKSIKITADADGNNVLCTGSVTVEPATAANLSMTYYVTGANSANNYTSLDYSLPFYITIKNNNSAVYHDYIIVNLYNSNDVLIDTKSIICNIATGEQMSKTFTFDNLQLGKYYAKVHYYNYNDQVQALRTIYYTVAEPYDVWVNGIRVNSANEDGVTGPGISGTITYLPSTNTLTLNNATLDIRGMSVNAITNAYGGSPNLKIKLVGTNKILAEAYKIAIDVKESQGFTLYGSGTLTCGGALYLDARDHMTNNNTKSYIKDCSVDINQIISEDYEESLIIDNADVTTEYLNVGGDYNGNVGLTLLNCRVVSPSGGYTKDGCIYVGNEEWLGHVEIKRGTASTIPGDVNGDGDVTGSDVTALYNYLLFNDSSAIVNGDQNGDGNITGSDVTAVYNILLGL